MFQALSRTLAASLALALTLGLGSVHGKPEAPAQGAQGTIPLSELPKQGVETYNRILRGGPFQYDKDGSTFGNREKMLPAQPRGYYREYTVKTPYSRDRGARRIVCGGEKPQIPDVCFYTSDHYASFKIIVAAK